jgi:hypothetical protein
MIDEMNSQEPSPAAMLGARGALLLGGALLLALTIVAVSAANDGINRTTLESFERVTAVGDAVYLDVPKEVPATALAMLGDKPLYAASPELVETRDSRMQLVQRDAASGLGIYAANAAVETKQGDRPRTGETLYFLKVKTDEYLMVTPVIPAR